MEGRIEHPDLRNCRQSLGDCPDAEKIGRIVERGYVTAFFDLGNDLVIYQFAAEELLASVYYPVSYSLDVLKR